MKKFISNNKLAGAFFIISIAGITLDLVNHFWGNNPISSHLPEWFIFLLQNLSYGVFVGVIIWFISTYYHEKKQVDIIKRRLLVSYNSFKKRVIEIVLEALREKYDEKFVEQLSHHENFMKYLDRKEEHSDKRHLFTSRIDDEEYRNNLLDEFRFLQREINYMLNANIMYDKKTYDYFCNVTDAITRSIRQYEFILLEKGNFYNFDKELMERIGYFVGRCSASIGYVEEEEHMEEMIQKI